MAGLPLHIFVVRDDVGSHAYNLEQQVYQIGRSEQATIRIISSDVSRYHATLIRVANAKGQVCYKLVDGNAEARKPSTNGTYVNDERIDAHVLRNRDKIVFGSSVVGKFFYFESQAVSNPDFALECRLDPNLKTWAEEQSITIDTQQASFPEPSNHQRSTPKGSDRFSNQKQATDPKVDSDQKSKFPNPAKYGKLGQVFVRKALISKDQLDRIASNYNNDQERLAQQLVKQGLISKQDLEQALQNQTIKLGEVLVKKGLITPEQLHHALEQQELTRKQLGEILVLMGAISSYELEAALQEQFWRRSGFWFLK